MRTLTLTINEQNFNLLWRSLHALENDLLATIERNINNPESEEAAHAGNDLVYLHLYIDDLEKKAKAANFNHNTFNLSHKISRL